MFAAMDCTDPENSDTCNANEVRLTLARASVAGGGPAAQGS